MARLDRLYSSVEKVFAFKFTNEIKAAIFNLLKIISKSSQTFEILKTRHFSSHLTKNYHCMQGKIIRYYGLLSFLLSTNQPASFNHYCFCV